MSIYSNDCSSSSCGICLVNSTCGDRIKRIITFYYPFEWTEASSLSIFSSGENITSSILYSWSTDKVCWTSWTTWTQYKFICSHLDTDYFLRILFSGSLDSIKINGTTPEYTICLDNSNIFLSDFCSSSSETSIYDGLDCALLLQQQLADSIICMLGIPIYYIKVNPDTKTEDFSFKEYVLHEATEIKKIKLMIEDGALPSSNPNLTTLDFDWSNDWPTELSKTQFATAFGDTAIPQKRDLVYVPLLKRMYEVNSAYDERNEGLMWRSTTWTLSLIKYTEKNNVDTELFSNIIDGWIENKYQSVMGCPEKNEQERESGTNILKSPYTTNTNLYNIEMSDSVRKEYTKDTINVKDFILYHRNNIVSRNYYQFLSEDSQIVYQQPACGDEGTIILLIETSNSVIESTLPLIKVGNIEIYIKNSTIIYTDNLSTEEELNLNSKYIIVCTWSSAMATAELHIYSYVHEDMPVLKLRPEMYWFDFEEPKYEISSIISNDWNMTIRNSNSSIILYGYSLAGIYNFKYYSRYLSGEDLVKECIKYTSNHPACIICDCARPFYTEGHGYAIK